MTAIGLVARRGSAAFVAAVAICVVAWSAPIKPRVTEAILYTQRVAEVTAEAEVEGGAPVVLSLPPSIDDQSVRVDAGKAQVTTSVRPAEGNPQSATEPPKIAEYLCTVDGLPAGRCTITLHYMLAGLGWSPNYTLRLAGGGAAKLVLAARIRNEGPAL